jgi:glycosyltransferase involved in cell wall biosynthesis
MLHKKMIVVVLPAYQAEKTLERSYQDIPKDIFDQIIMVDDASSDRTVEVAHRLGIKTIRYNKNLGYRFAFFMLRHLNRAPNPHIKPNDDILITALFPRPRRI